MARERATIVWGQGLDRATGALASDDATFLDIRNLLIRDSKLLSRGGLVAPSGGSPLSAVGDIVGCFPFRTSQGIIVVGYNRDTRDLTVWTLDGFGASPTLIGTWDTLIDGAPLPVVTGAESYGKFFLAHAEPLYNYRVKTIYYDPSQDPGSQLVSYQQDLDGDGTADTFFRGVYSYLDYLFAYGFGTASDGNRPEIVHVTLPGDPTSMDPQQYFLAGVKGEAVTGLLAVGGVLRVQKKGRSYVITGTSAADFGIEPLEEVYGQINDRAGFAFGSQAVFWSEQGPRIAGGDGTALSQDIALPLELDGPPPSGLAEQGDDGYAWAVYNAEQRIGIFGFPVLSPAGAVTLCYVVSLRQPGVIRWTYFEVEQCIYSACLVIEGAPSVGSTLTAYADTVAASDTAQSGTGRTVHVSWNNNALIGGETAQVFVQPDGGDWILAASAAASGSTGSVDITGLQALKLHHFAVRYVKGGYATAGYNSINPDEWTATTASGAKVDATTSCSTPAALAGSWSRIGSSTHQIAFTFTLPETGVGFELQQSDDGVGGWADVETPAAPYDTREIDHATLDALLTTTKYYRLRAVLGSNDSSWSSTATVFIGPTETPDFELLAQTTSTPAFQVWLRRVGSGATKLQVQTSPDGSTWTTQFSSGTYSLHQDAASGHSLSDGTWHVRLRYLVTASGVDDPAPWVDAGTIALTSGAVPSAPTHGAGILLGESGGAYWITLTFDAPGSGYGIFAEYTADDGFISASDVTDDPDTEIDILDSVAYGWEYTVFNGSPKKAIKLYRVDRSGGGFKVSAAESFNAVPDASKAPTLCTVSTLGIGELAAAFLDGGDNTTTTDIVWFPPAGPFSNYFGGTPIANTGVGDVGALEGPSLGYPALPAPGTVITVRFVTILASGFPSAAVDVHYTVGS